MKQTLSVKKLGFSLLAALGCLTSQAQTTLNTNYTNTNNHFIINFNGNIPQTPRYITFTVTNNNCYPISITDFNIFHVDSMRFTDGFNIFDVSNNGGIYTVLRQTSGTITSQPTTGSAIATWPIVGTSNPITTASNGIVPILSGVQTSPLTRIEPGAGNETRFAIVLNDTIVSPGVPGFSLTTPPVVASPGTFTVNGVTITTVDPTFTAQKIRYGRYPDAPIDNQAPTLNSNSWQHSFEGGINFKRSGPAVAVINDNACDTSGDFITLTASVPSCVTKPGYSWTGPGLTGTVVGNPIQIPATLANAGKYYVTYVDSASLPLEASAPTEVEIHVTPRPKAPKITTKTAYCIGEPFQPVVADGQNILWYTVPSGGTGTTVPPYVNTNMAGSYTWYASQTVNNCEGPRTGVTITVAPIPARPTVVSPTVYCENAPATPLTAGGSGLIWYVDPVGGLGSVIAPIPGTSVRDTLTWYVSQKVDGCEGPRAKLDVIITFKPNGMILVSDTPWICQHEELTFSYYGSATEFTGITWTVPTPYATSVGGGIGLDPIRIRFDSAGLQKVVMSANNLGCLSDPYTQYVTVKPIPRASIFAPSDVCPNDDRIISLSEFSPTIDTFNWNWDGGVTSHFATDQGPYGVYWTTPGVKVITLDLVDELCRGFATDTIVVRELPDAKIKAFYHNEKENRFDDFDFKKATICSGDSLRLEPNSIVASSTYEWTPTRFFDNASNIPVTYGRIDFTGNVSLKVTDDLGCISVDSIRVETKPCCEITFPNAFTPNGDGRNDVFRAITAGYHNTRTFQIINRYGQVVHESVDEHRGWDGTLKGEPADLGTYFYHINFKCDGKWTDQSGEFILVR